MGPREVFIRRRLLDLGGLSVAALAEEIGVTRGTVYGWLAGQSVSADRLQSLADALRLEGDARGEFYRVMVDARDEATP